MKSKRIIVAYCFVMLCCLLFKFDVNAEQTIDFGKIYSDTISTSNINNYYKINVPKSGKITINLESELDWVNIILCDDEFVKLYKESADCNDITHKIKYKSIYYLTSGIYYIDIGKTHGNYGDYSFSVDYEDSQESFSESGKGNNNDIYSANEINFDVNYNSQIAHTDGIDYYKFTINESRYIYIDATANNNYLYFDLYDSEGTHLYHDCESKNDVTNLLTMKGWYHLQAGTYYYAISTSDYGYSCGSKYSRYQGICKFKLSYMLSDESFKENGSDDSFHGANKIKLNKKYDGMFVKNHSDEDYYKFTIKKSDNVCIDVTAYVDLNVYLYNEDGDKLDSITAYSNNKNNKLSTFLLPGTYYVRFIKKERFGAYDFTVSSYNAAAKPDKVSVISAKSLKKKTATIRWKKVGSANGYQIQYSTSKKFKNSKSKFVGRNKTSIKISKLASKKKYYVKIRAYKNINGMKKYGKWSKIKTVKIK